MIHISTSICFISFRYNSVFYIISRQFGILYNFETIRDFILFWDTSEYCFAKITCYYDYIDHSLNSSKKYTACLGGHLAVLLAILTFTILKYVIAKILTIYDRICMILISKPVYFVWLAIFSHGTLNLAYDMICLNT